MRRNFLEIFVVVLAFFMGFATLYIVNIYYPLGATTKIVKELEISDTSINPSVEKVFDSAVAIEVFRGNFLIGTGSGFVYKVDDKNGYILTNQHVIENATSVQIIFSDDSVAIAEILGSDLYSDVAVLSVSKNNISQVATLGNPDKLKVGDIVFTIGSPSGSSYRGTVTKGIVSTKTRLITIESIIRKNWILKVIQTDAAINPGNSGGPLVNVNGEVVGITSLKLGTDEKIEGVGFAIPLSDIINYTDRLEKKEPIIRPIIDLGVVNLSDSRTINRLGLTSDGKISKGIMVIAVGQSIELIKRGNIIIALNDVEVNSADYFNYLISKYEVGDKVEIRYYDGKSIKTTNLTLPN